MLERNPAAALSYGDLVFPPTHPGVVAAVGALVGLTPPPVAECRVLELGCGTGFNLIAMAQSTPGARFTGIDLSAAHIERARHAAEVTGTRNAEFRCISIDEFPEELGMFDYVIAHGVYSWVPPATRAAMFGVIQRHLTPHGLAYVSYNANPGWRLRGLIRDTLLFLAHGGDSETEQIARCRAGMERLSGSLTPPDSLYAKVLQAEWEPVRHQPDYYLAHEHLVPHEESVYFEEFVRQASGYGLRFAAEARLVANSFAQPEPVRAQLAEAAGEDLSRREQYLDFLVGRYFRQSLLCHARLTPAFDAESTGHLHLNVVSNVEIVGRAPGLLWARPAEGPDREVTDEADRRILEFLAAAGGRPVPAIALEPAVLEAFQMTEMAGFAEPLVAAAVLSGLLGDLWMLRADTPAMVAQVSDNPRACPLARFQAAAGEESTNRLHRNVRLTEAERQLLILADGSRTLDRLAAESGLDDAQLRQVLNRFAGLSLLEA